MGPRGANTIWADTKDLAEYRSAPPSNARRKRSSNPLLEGINTYLPDFHKQILGANDFLPSRYLLYPPLLIVPAAFETISPMWEAEYADLDASQKDELFRAIVQAFQKAGQNVTHIALNAPVRKVVNVDNAQLPNVLRSPTGFKPLYGDWGPPAIEGDMPTARDFREGFWVSTKQDHGIIQTWAPRWTMFSQGNLSEKKRVLGTAGKDIFEGQDVTEIEKMQVLDMYVGIGYFALCYLARGVSRVWGWDLNGWSIEGLRRGCEANGWKCAVVEVSRDGEATSPSIEHLVQQLQGEEGLPLEQQTRCIAFRGNNEHALGIVKAIEAERARQNISGSKLRFDHVNLGLLPSSMASWIPAMQLVRETGRLHIHKNSPVAMSDQAETDMVEPTLKIMAETLFGTSCRVVHVEHVKTYGPGVEHRVLDLHIGPGETTAS